MNALALLWQASTLPLPAVDWSLADLLLRGTLVLTVVLIVLRLLQRRSAALQHLAGLIGCIALLALPLVMSLAPAWLGFLPGTAFFGAQAGSGAGSSAPVVAIVRTLLAVWAAGTLFMFARLLVGQAFLSRTFARAAPLQALSLDAVALHHGLTTRTEVRASSEIDVPLAFGILQPKILLPESALRWSQERLRVVLLHETAHLQRLDPAAQLITLVACCVYWFHPLAWRVARHLALARERACDDRVLGAGSDADRYARQLVRIAESLAGRRPPLPAVAMARPSQLRSRLTALLDTSADRRTVRLQDAALVLIIGLLVLSPLSAVGTRAAAGTSEPERVAVPATGHGHRGTTTGHASGDHGHQSGHGSGHGAGHTAGHGGHSGHASGDHGSGDP